LPQLRRDVRTALKLRPDTPQVNLRSPFAGDAHMGDIIIEGDPYFVRHGSIIVEQGPIEIYRFTPDGDQLHPPQLKVQRSGRLWNQNDRIRVWVWSRTGDEVRMSMWLNVDLSPIPPTAAVLPPNRAEILQFAPSNDPLPNTALAFASWLRGVLDGVADPTLRADLFRLIDSGFDIMDRDAMLPRLGDHPEIRDRLAALDETLPDPGYDGSAMFPLKTYNGEDHARLVHMRGALNVALLLTHDPPTGVPAREPNNVNPTNVHTPPPGPRVT